MESTHSDFTEEAGQAAEDTTLDGAAVRVAHVRDAGDGDAILLDLGGEDRHGVWIDDTGWEVVDVPNGWFRRPTDMEALPHPSHHGDLHWIRRMLGVDADGWAMVVAWMLAAFQPIDSPPLICYASNEQSLNDIVRVLTSVLDPSASSPMTRNNAASWVRHYRVAPTAEGFSMGAVENSSLDEILQECENPTIVTVLGDKYELKFPEMGLHVHLSGAGIPDRLAPGFWADLDRMKDQVLGGLLGAVSRAMRESPFVELPDVSPIADLIHLVTAAEDYLGWPSGYFQTVLASQYIHTQQYLDRLNAVGWAVRKVMEQIPEFRVRPDDLMALLTARVPEFVHGIDDFPESFDDMIRELQQNKSELRRQGVWVDGVFDGSAEITVSRLPGFLPTSAYPLPWVTPYAH